MCLAIPRLVLQVRGDRAEVLYDGVPRWVLVDQIPDLAAGDYVVVYADVALERIPPEEAQEALEFLDGLEAMLEEATLGGPQLPRRAGREGPAS
jgi:hydrogenase expression/formation protein HypC